MPRNQAFVRMLVAVAALAAALALSSCGIFKTAAPQPPDTGVPEPPDFTTPDMTLTTLARAVRARNSTNYSQCFPDTNFDMRDFHATFDAADLAAFQFTHPGVVPDWNREQELSFFPRFVTLNASAIYETFFLRDNRPGRGDISFSASKLLTNRIYRVYAGGGALVAGSAAITLERVGGASEWKITFWEDRIDTSGVETWGRARLNVIP